MTTMTRNQVYSPAGAYTTRVGAALAVLRTVVGIVFAANGEKKLLIFGFAGVIGAFAGGQGR